MHNRRLATLLLGMWLAGSLFMYAIAVGNFRGVDQLLAEPGPSANQIVKMLGENSSRTFLRHQVSELNRSYFNNWEWAQLLLGLTLLATMVFDTPRERLYLSLCGFLLLLIVIEHFLLTPHLTAVGRELDFIPPDEPTTARIKFGRFHQAYTVMEAGKMILLSVFSFRLMKLGRRGRPRSRKKVDPVDHANSR